ncbi:adenine phosphoribosyltransferase [Myxococcota bacterium]|nr:adenine phosphoribosyltransferase [Myxococcota bacterium]
MVEKHGDIADRVRGLIRDVPDFPKPGIVFKDLTTVFRDGDAMRGMIHAFAERYRAMNVEAIVGIESRGFVIAAPLAVELGKGLVIVRKPGKLPWKKRSRSYDLEYGTDTLEMHEDAVAHGTRVVVVDDLLATGGTMAATCELLREAGAEVVEACFAVELSFLRGRARLQDIGCHALVTY